MAKTPVPNLIVEFISDPGNLHFLSVIEYGGKEYLVVVDNISETEVGAYVVDLIQQEKIDFKAFYSLVTRWFYASSDFVPLSFEVSKLGLTPILGKIYRTFETPHVTRLRGNGFCFDFEESCKIRRRKVSTIQSPKDLRLKA